MRSGQDLSVTPAESYVRVMIDILGDRTDAVYGRESLRKISKLKSTLERPGFGPPSA